MVDIFPYTDLLKAYAPVMLPTLLVLLSFAAKMSIERHVDAPKVLQGLAELPADIMFLAMSFCVAYGLSAEANLAMALILLVFFMLITMFVMVMWRKTEMWFAQKHWWKFTFICIVNYVFSVFALVGSVSINVVRVSV